HRVTLTARGTRPRLVPRLVIGVGREPRHEAFAVGHPLRRCPDGDLVGRTTGPRGAVGCAMRTRWTSLLHCRRRASRRWANRTGTRGVRTASEGYPPAAGLIPACGFTCSPPRSGGAVARLDHGRVPYAACFGRSSLR